MRLVSTQGSGVGVSQGRFPKNPQLRKAFCCRPCARHCSGPHDVTWHLLRGSKALTSSLANQECPWAPVFTAFWRPKPFLQAPCFGRSSSLVLETVNGSGGGQAVPQGEWGWTVQGGQDASSGNLQLVRLLPFFPPKI